MFSQFIVRQYRQINTKQYKSNSYKATVSLKMSTNNFLSNLISSSNRSPKSRSSSLFASSRQLPLFTSLANREQQKKNRSSSVSKLLENKNNPNELIKWTPLIKTVHKLGAKMKKQYFFFWCRMEAYIKAKHGISCKDIKLIENKQSNLTLNQQNTQKVQPKIEQQLDKNREFFSKQAKTNTHQKIINQPKAQIQQITETQVKNQEINSDECSSQNQELNITVLSQFVISLSKIIYKVGQMNLKAAFKQILVKSCKVKALEKLKDIGFKAHTKSSQYSVIRTLKKNSHYIIKIEILGNTLKSLIRKCQHYDLKQFFDLVKQKAASFQQKKEEKLILSTVSIEPEFRLDTKVLSEKIIQVKQKQSSQPQGQTPRFTFNSDQKKSQLSSPCQENPQIIQSIKSNNNTLSSSKPLMIIKINQAKPLYLKSECHNKAISKQTVWDKGLIKNYSIQSQRDYERMKKLSRLYVEEPLYQLPDISQITLFDGTINSPQIFSKIYSNANQSQKCKQHQSSISTQTQRSQPEHFIFNREEQSVQFQQYKISSQISPQMSPRFEKKCQQIQNDESQQLKNVISQQFCSKDQQYKNEDLAPKKSPSCTLTLTKNSSSSQINSKSINLKTPVSSKKYTDPFTKKRSIDILVKMPSDSKKCESKLFTNNSTALLKRFDVQIKEESKKKVSQAQKMNSKQKYHLSYGTFSGKKTQKSRQKQEKTVNHPQSALKQNYHSIHSSLKENYNLTPKLIEKSIDLSSKKNIKNAVKTSQKKENKENYSNELFKSSSKKVITTKNSSKQNKLSEFNEVNSSAKVIKYNDFMKKCPSTKGQQHINHPALKQIQKNNESDPTFQPIHLTQQDYGSKQVQLYETVSAQFVKDKSGQLNKQKQKSTRLRTKIDKIQLNTARKMKLQIESMINQRKKTSIGFLKF